jgi:hypothetical protein
MKFLFYYIYFVSSFFTTFSSCPQREPFEHDKKQTSSDFKDAKQGFTSYLHTLDKNNNFWSDFPENFFRLNENITIKVHECLLSEHDASWLCFNGCFGLTEADDFTLSIQLFEDKDRTNKGKISLMESTFCFFMHLCDLRKKKTFGIRALKRLLLFLDVRFKYYDYKLYMSSKSPLCQSINISHNTDFFGEAEDFPNTSFEQSIELKIDDKKFTCDKGNLSSLLDHIFLKSEATQP